MTTTPELEIGRLLWELVMSRPAVRETHAAYVGTTEFLTIDGDLAKVVAQVEAIEAGQTLTETERALVTKIKASVDALSRSRLQAAQSHVVA
jgi:hypothetical protein